ncbi:MAG: Type 1 glutamine amidotransferase-like domain-containing protein [Candidatus Paceibacterota bacterium]|jgi:dipeptidase E
MKLYLSSYGVGDKGNELVGLLGENKKVAVIPNALDFSTDIDRRKISQQRELDGLSALGLMPEELDLRPFFDTKRHEELDRKIRTYGLIWARGGNAFILRRALFYSGLDKILLDLKHQNEIVYGGYSAGVCVIGPTLHGIELVDDVEITPEGYEHEIIWNGVGLIDFSFAPHFKSDHRESGSVDKLVNFYELNKMPYKALRDGEVIIQVTL